MSNLADEYEYSQYEEVERLDKKGNIYIVKDIRDKSIWVKKEIDVCGLYAYNKLINVRNSNIAYIRKILHIDEKIYVIEEYINGKTIGQLVKENAFLKPQEVCSIMCGVCDGITALHKSKVIHRDITHSNIIISLDGTAKIVDLGISRVKNEYKNKDTTIMGTAGYASPEQFGFSQTDVTSDIYSCGVLMNFMLTGGLPDECEYKGKMKYILDCCMRLDPKARYQSAEELKIAVSNCYLSPKDILKIPGFRSNKLWKKLIAAVIYSAFIFFICGSFLNIIMRSDWASARNGFYFGFLYYIIPFFLWSDYLYYLERLPFIRSRKKIIRNICGVAFAIVFYLIALKFYI